MKTKFTFVLLLLLFTVGQSFAQVVINTTPTSYQPATLAQGGIAGTYRVDITNNNAAALSGAKLTVTLPAGMEYVSGSITGATQSNISNLQIPIFALADLPSTNTVTVTFSARINCGFTNANINYNVLSSGNVSLQTAVSPVAASTPAPAYVFSGVPSPQALPTPLNTNATRTVKFKNSGNVSVSTVYFDTNVVTGTQYPYYKLLNSNFGTVTPITNGYRITLTGAALQSAITTTSGTANTSFDNGEEITLVLTEQMTNCALGSSIQLNMKAGSGDSKNNFCFYDSSTASITTQVGNPAIALDRIVASTSYPDYCNNGKVSYNITNTGSTSGGVASALFNVKLPWSPNYVNSGQAPLVNDGHIMIRKVYINGNDITNQVLKRNGTADSALIVGLGNCYVIDFSGLTSAYGTALQSLDGDGKFDDLPAGQTFKLDFEYGFEISNYQTCQLASATLPQTSEIYFSLGTSFANQCGARENKVNYASGAINSSAQTFLVGGQSYKGFGASLSVAALYPGDKTVLSTSFAGSISGAFLQFGKVVKTFTIVLPDGLDYDSAGITRIYNGTASSIIPTTAITYNAGTKTLTIAPAANQSYINLPNDALDIPLVASSVATVSNKGISYSTTIGFVGCSVTAPYGCNSATLNYAIITGNCPTVGTTAFDMTRATFGYVPPSGSTNVFFQPTAFVNENTPGINLHGAVSKDKVKVSFKGTVNSTNFTELWARVKYKSNATTANLANFETLSANASDIVGKITVTKASDGSILTTNLLVGDITYSYDSGTGLQYQQSNIGTKIGAGKAINYALAVGDKIEVNWYTRVSKTNLSWTYSQLENLEGDLYTKDAGGISSNCDAIPVGFFIQRLNMAANAFSGVQAIAGTNSLRVSNSIINGNHSEDIPGDHFPNEVRTYANFRTTQATLPGIWQMDTATGKEPYYLVSTVALASAYKLDRSLFNVSYSGGNTIVTFNNDALGSNGMPSSTANIPVVSDWIGVNGNANVSFFMLPICVPSGNITVTVRQAYDLYTTEADNSNVEYVPNSYTQGGTSSVYYNYTANASPTLQNVDGVGSTVNWQVRVANTSDTATIVAAGGGANLPNNWMGFVSPNNNITITKLTDVATGTIYPVINYGAGKYWVKLGDIATTATYNVEATYTTCANDKIDFTYGFGATGYPMDPDQGYGAELATCTANQTSFVLNLLPKDIGIDLKVKSPANPVQFCTNDISVSGDHLIDYEIEVTNTGTGNAENLILEAAFPANYTARAGTSKLTYDGITKNIGDPVLNTAKGVWQWYISADANAIPFLPPASTGKNVMTLSYQGETTCGYVSGSSVAYNMNATSGCGQLTQVAASGDGMELSVVPPALNVYALTPGTAELKNDGSGAVYSIEIKNQGSNPISTNENIYITLPSSIDYVAGSVERTIGAGNITEPTGNIVVGKTRIITFPLPTGASGNTLVQNETASFSIKFKIIDPAALSCGTIAKAIKLESIYSVPDVDCGASKCPVIFVTGTSQSDAVITKTALGITLGTSTAKFVSTVNNDVTVKYTITNTGTIASYAPIVVDFFNDINKDGLYTTGEPILYTQTINNGDATIAAGGTSPEQTTAVFAMPESGMCNVTAAIRLVNNNQVCADSATLIPINFEAAQTAFTVCGKTNVTIGNASNGATVSWSPNDGNLSAVNISNPVFNYIGTPVTTATDFVYTATVVHPGGCDNTYTTTVTVNPDPVITITNPAPVCAGTSVDLSAPAVTQGSAANLTYTYFTDADATVALVNYTAVTAEGTYYIRGENANGCYSVMPVVVTVNPLPTASVVAAGPVCQGDTSPVVTFRGADGTAPYTFTYNINGGSNLTVSTVSGNSVNVPVSTAAAGSFVYTLVSVADSSSTACTQPQNGFTTSIVNPLPTASISGTAEVCHNGTAPAVTFTGANGTAPYTFTYKINGGDDQTVITTAGNSVAVDAPTDTAGTFTYTLVSVKDGSSIACEQAQTGTATITVKVLPTAVIYGAAEVCKNGASPLVTFTGDNGTAPYTFKYTVNGGAEQSITTISGSSVTVAAPTNAAGDLEYALISVRESSSCEQLQTGSVIIKVNDLPTATISGSDSVCQNEPNPDITFRASGGAAPYTFTYKINGGADQTISTAGGSTATVSVPTGTAGTYVYSLVSVTEGSTNACGQLQTGFATVTVNAAPTVAITNPAAVCSGESVNLTAATVTAGSTTNLTYAYFTDALGTAVLANPSAVTADGIYYIQGTTASGCSSAISPVIVTVNPTPTVVITNPAAVCSGTSVDLTAAAVTDGSTAGLTFTYFTDAAAVNALAAPSAVTLGGDYYIKGSTPQGCYDIEKVTVTVNPTPTVVTADPAAVCQGTTVDLTAAAVTAGSTAGLTFAYFTDAAGTAALASPSAVAASGTYYIQGTTAQGCKSAVEPVAVTIDSTPALAITNPAAVCSGTAVDLTAPAVTAGSAAGLAYAYYTDAAGTAVLANPNAVTAGGTYYIQGTAAGECKSAIEPVTVTVNPTPTVVTADPAAVCQGTAVDLTAAAVTAGSTAGLTYAYFTDAAGTSALASPNAVTAGGTYYIQGTTAEGCSSAVEPVTVTVNPTPTVVTADPAAVCQGTAVDLTAAAVTAGSTAGLTYAYYTDAAGTSALASPNAVTAGGTYYVQGTTAEGCNSAVEPVTVTVNPTPTVVTADPAAVCQGTAVDLTAPAVTAGSTTGLTYAYFTDAAGTAALAAPNAVTAGGTYYIQGTTAAGCKSAVQSVTVTVNPTPTVVTADPAAVCQGTAVDLTAPAVTAGSTAGLTYAYFTDAAGTAALASPNAVTAGGTYYVQGTTAEGCSSAVQSVTVTVNPTPTVVTASPAAVCQGTAVDLTAAAVTAGSTAGLTYAYFTDAAGTAALASPNAVTADGTYYIQGTTAEGCSSAVEPVTVTVNPTPTVVTADPAAVCQGTAVDLTAAAVTAGSTAGLTYAYFTDAAGTAALAAPSAVTEAGTYYIQGTTAEGCKSAIQPVTITVNVLLALNGTESTLCAVDGTGYVLSFSVTGQAPYTVTGTGAPGTWSGNDWTSDKILAGTDYNVSVQDAYACNTITVANTAPICCAYEVKAPTFASTTVACYDQIPTAGTLTKAEYEALGNGDGSIGNVPCGVIEITASNSLEPACNGTVTRTYTVTEYEDSNNNGVRDAGENTVLNTTSSEQLFTLERADFVMPANGAKTVECSSAVVAPAVPEVKDNCGNVLVASAPVISAMPACNGTVTYTYTFTDCAGHKHDWVYTYTIDNTMAPKGTAPADITVQCIDDIPAANVNAVTNVTGNCSNSVTVTITDSNNGGSGCVSNPYIVTRTYTLTDCGGLTAKLVQTITVKDTTAPVFVEALPSNLTLECKDAIPSAVTLTATDNCSTATVSYNEVKVNGSCPGNYQLQRTWTAVDACGNETKHTQIINIADTTAPVFVETLPAAEINASCDTIPEAVTLTARDNCGNATVTYNEEKIDGSCSGKYTLVRTWTAIDDCSNRTSFTQTINVSCLEVFNALSPNGDGINDSFVIKGIDCFPNNTVTIYNRYGVKVYEKKGYDNVTNPFEGFSDGRATVLKGDKLPTGTYFYTLEYEDNGKMVQKSAYLYINNQ
ncbi:gliding motility-associated C-terminal domain-containing protein [Flavobacterium sp.]|uniref:Ig-like domain-containing protein n=1 Tax=Flavobacterium sp. TaxID=239 RepID=UPI0031D67076